MAIYDTMYQRQCEDELLDTLTSSCGTSEEGAQISENTKIYLKISNYLDFLIILMKAKRHPKARLVVVEIVVNILVSLNS